MEIAAPHAQEKCTLRRTYKYRLYPTRVQQVALNEQLAWNCSLYNAALEHRKRLWCEDNTGRRRPKGERGVGVGCYDQQLELTEIRASMPFPEKMSRKLQCDALNRLDRAFQAFYRRCKAGETPGYPRFRAPERYNSLTWPLGNGAGIREGRVCLAGIGSVRIRWHRNIPEDAAIRTITVKRSVDRWYVHFSCEIPKEAEAEAESVRNGPAVGVDVGVINYFALSTGERVPGLTIDSKRVQRAARKVSRRTRGSNRRRKAILLLARQREREVNYRRDWAHKRSRELITEFSLVAVENLNHENMRKSARGTVEKPGKNVRQKAGLNRRISEQGWGQFISFLEYKAEEAGARVVKVNPRYTSQTCSECGHVASESRKDERFCCVACGFTCNADVNAAKNILAKALEIDSREAGTQPSGANGKEKKPMPLSEKPVMVLSR